VNGGRGSPPAKPNRRSRIAPLRLHPYVSDLEAPHTETKMLSVDLKGKVALVIVPPVRGMR
jgi:hypothetical protein